jgi:hypothetical protein
VTVRRINTEGAHHSEKGLQSGDIRIGGAGGEVNIEGVSVMGANQQNFPQIQILHPRLPLMKLFRKKQIY